MRLFNLILSAALMAVVFLCNPAMAKDYKFFSVDFGSEWAEFLPETNIKDMAYTLILTNKKDPSINVMVASTVLVEGALDKDGFDKKVKWMIDDMAKNGVVINDVRYEAKTDRYYLEGISSKVPICMCMFHKKDIMFNFSVMNADKSKIEEGLKIVDRVKLKI